MMNGALTVGTRDGATIEMAAEAGEENFFLFGLTAEEVAGSRGLYDPFWHYRNGAETRDALDLIFNDHFSCREPGIFGPIRDALLTRGDYYMHLADLQAYVETQGRVAALYADPDGWARKAIINVACSGRFSSDRTIREYAAEIWHATPSPVAQDRELQAGGGWEVGVRRRDGLDQFWAVEKIGTTTSPGRLVKGSTTSADYDRSFTNRVGRCNGDWPHRQGPGHLAQARLQR